MVMTNPTTGNSTSEVMQPLITGTIIIPPNSHVDHSDGHHWHHLPTLTTALTTPDYPPIAAYTTTINAPTTSDGDLVTTTLHCDCTSMSYIDLVGNLLIHCT
ncbi:unnamed protein product [Schistocephalus solidus]|uniref:Uncharacterized protein n=1 Tax=Schistocephalus solidus TaxID=70667 RepID=A0A183T5K0_SCHSO|nr:unnamed protein product [Schistocephalus solidus]